MPFTAVIDDKIINVINLNEPRKQLNGKKISCRACDSPMFLRASIKIRPHFSHFPGKRKACLYDHINESEEHLAGKEAIHAYLTKHHLYAGAKIEYEVPLMDIGRIADVLVTHRNGIKEVHEMQLSPQRPDQLEQRTNDYLVRGEIMEVFWWLGGKANTHENKTFLDENYGYYATITFHKTRAYIQG